MVGTAQVPLGSLLVEMGFIDEAQLEQALSEQTQSGLRLGKILIQSGRITEDRLVHALSRQLGIEACDPIMTPVHEAVLAMVPAELAFDRRVLPVARQRDGRGEVLYVATADPLDDTALEALKRVVPASTTVRWMLAGETEMDLALARHYGAAPAASSSPELTPVPTGTPVITGVPVSAPPRNPGEPSLASLSSTGDIFAALQEAVELSEPPPPEPSVTTPAPLVPEAASLPVRGPEPSHPSIDLARLQGSLHDEISEEILEAEEVVESGIHPPESLAPPPEPFPAPDRAPDLPPEASEETEIEAPPPAAAAPEVASADSEPPEVDPADVQEAQEAWPSSSTLSTGSWGDMLDGSSPAPSAPDASDEQEVLRNVAAEATELPSATDSIPALPAEVAEAPRDATDGPAEVPPPVSTPPTELVLEPDAPTAIPTGEAAPAAETMWPAPAELDLSESSPPVPSSPPAPVSEEEPTQEDIGAFMEAAAAQIPPPDPEDDPGLRLMAELGEAQASEAAPDFPSPDFPSPDFAAPDTSLDLPIEDSFDEIPSGVYDAAELDGPVADAAPPAPAASASDAARTLVRRFVAGDGLSEAETTWVLRLVAGLALQGDLLEDDRLEPVLARLGPPPA